MCRDTTPTKLPTQTWTARAGDDLRVALLEHEAQIRDRKARLWAMWEAASTTDRVHAVRRLVRERILDRAHSAELSRRNDEVNGLWTDIRKARAQASDPVARLQLLELEEMASFAEASVREYVLSQGLEETLLRWAETFIFPHPVGQETRLASLLDMRLVLQARIAHRDRQGEPGLALLAA